MSPLAALLLYTPLPWLMTMYVAAYRHDPANGIIVTEQGRVPFFNQLTPMEHAYFTTKPEEAGKSRAIPEEAKPSNLARVMVANDR